MTATADSRGESTAVDIAAVPAVSVVVPCRNAADTLPELLDSLVRQRFDGAWELVVVDNHSTDETRAVLERYRDRLPLRIIETPPGPASGARARNCGAAASHASALLFVDADDVVADGWGRGLQLALREHRFVACRAEDVLLNEATWRRARGVDLPDGLLSWWDYPYPCAGAGTIGIRRELYAAVGGMDETMDAFEDIDFCWRVQLDEGVELVLAPDALLHYRYRTTLRGVFRQSCAYGRGMVAVYQRHRDRGLPIPPHQWKLAFWGWVRTIARVIRVRNRADVGGWLWRFGNMLGLLEGSVRYRTLLLCADPGIGRSPFARQPRCQPT
jgi:glycosyltransferase involved in cell wall biosynthesis